MKRFTHIIVPTDFSASSRAAIQSAQMMARQFEAQLSIVHVVEPHLASYAGMPFMPVVDLASETEQAARAGLRAEEEALAGQHQVRTCVRRGSAWREILEEAKECGADLIVMSTHGHTGLARALIGSTTEKVVRMSSIPVLSVHGLTTAAT